MKTTQIRSIETIHDMQTFINMVQNHMAPVCDLQDIYAHSHTANIDAIMIEMVSERKSILCAVYNTMAFDEVERLLKVLAQHKVSKQMAIEYAELDKREAALTARERAQQDARKPYHKKLAELKKQIAGLQRLIDDRDKSNDRMRAERNAAILEARQFAVEAEKYRTIKEMLV